MVISTPTVSYNTPLVWYAHFIFTVLVQDATKPLQQLKYSRDYAKNNHHVISSIALCLLIAFN